MNKAKKIIIIVLSCVVVLGGIYFALRTLKQKNQNSKTVGVYAVSEIGYDASSMWDNSTLSGNVTANSEQKVYVGKTQAVSEIKVKEGQTVKAGDVLLVYDTTANDLQLNLHKSELELSRVSIIDAQRELEKLKATTPLEDIPTTEAPAAPVATGSDAPKPDAPKPDADTKPDVDVPPTREELKKQIVQKEQEIKSMQTQYEIAQVKLQMEEMQNSTGEVLANFDGVIKSVTTADEAASSGNPVLVVSAADGYLVESQIGELAMSTVKVGDTVSMYCYDTGMNYEGTITEISTFPAEGNSNYSAKTETYYPMKIALNDASDVSQNMYMEITLGSGTEESSEGFYLSKAFMKQEGSNYYVMKDVDGKLKKTYIKVGNKTSGDAVLVLGGLTMQDYIAFPYLDEAVEGVRTVQKPLDELYN